MTFPNTTLMIDPPSAFAPVSELQAFLRRMRASPFREHPDAKRAMAEVRSYLSAARAREGSLKAKASKPVSTKVR